MPNRGVCIFAGETKQQKNMKEIHNELWNGKDAAFIRFINSETLDYFDLPIAYGDDFSIGNELLDFAHHLKHDNGIITGNYLVYDFWYRFYVKDGELELYGEDGTALGCVPNSDARGFNFNPETFEIISVCKMLYNTHEYRTDDNGNIVENDKKEEVPLCLDFIKEFNENLGKPRV